jgi:hypothetical protein
MPNLHNWYKSAERKNQIIENLAGLVLGWSSFNIVSDSPAFHSKWLLLLKVEISVVVNFCFITNQNEHFSKFGFRGSR